MKTKFSLLIVVSIILTSCAAPPNLTLNTQDAHFSDYKNGMAQVFFYRPCKILGAARGVYVLEDSNVIGALNCATYFVHQVLPGTYQYAAKDTLRGETYMTLTVEPDKQYYIKADLGWGFPDAYPYLEMLNQEDAKEIVKSLTYVIPEQ